mmetsp:Transcript_48444/g.156345  ORF Transcript_48444/g.156345 Transcript_48444/m.156345 type:complete len:304 (+) Transcript_48444:843-1754(+)
MQALLEGLRQRGIPRLGPVLARGLAGGLDECRVLGRRVPHLCCWAVARSGHMSFCSGRLPVDADHMLPGAKWDPDGRQRPRRESVGRRGAGQSFNFCACRAAIGPDLDVLSYCGAAGIHAWLGLDFHPRREGFELVEDVGLPHVGLQQFGRRLGVLQRRAVCLWPAEHQWHMGDPRLRLHRLSLGHNLCLRLRLGCGRLDARALHRPNARPHACAGSRRPTWHCRCWRRHRPPPPPGLHAAARRRGAPTTVFEALDAGEMLESKLRSKQWPSPGSRVQADPRRPQTDFQPVPQDPERLEERGG